MANSNLTPPPARISGMGGPGRKGLRAPVEKPRDLKGTLRRLWHLTKGNRQGIGWLPFLSALASASAILSPLVIGYAVTAIDQNNAAITILLLLTALYFCDWFVRFAQQFLMASIGQKIIHHIRVALFHVINTLPFSFFDQRQHGELMSRLTNDVDNINTTIFNSLTQLLTVLFTISGIFFIMLALSPLLTLISLIGVGLIFLLTRIVTAHTRKLFSEQQKILGKLNGQIEENISSETIVKAFCLEKQMIEQFEESNEQFCKVATRALI